MKNILGLALSLAMVALIPSVGNAADKIEMNCSEFDFDAGIGSFLFEPTNKKQEFAGESALIRWEQKFMLADFGAGDIVKIDYVSGDAILKGKIIGNCKFKNLGLIKEFLRRRAQAQARLDKKQEPASGAAQSAGLQVGCGMKTFNPTDKPDINFSGSINKVDGTDFAKQGKVTVSVQITGNQNTWNVDASVVYKKIGDRIEFTGKHELPASAEDIKERFGEFMEVKCVAK